MSKKPKPERGEFDLRTFPHANSYRKIVDRYEEDREDAREFTDSFSTNRKGGKRNVPDAWDDEATSLVGKYPVKPKKHNIKRDTIRKNEEDQME